MTTALDITGATVKWTMRRRWDSATILQKTTTSGIVLTTPASGIMTVSVADTDTVSLDPGAYFVDCEMTLSGKVYTVLMEGIDLWRDVS